MQLEIYSERLGRSLTFSKPGACYMFVDLNDGIHTEPQELCEGGKTTGIRIGDVRRDMEVFKNIVTRWLEQYENIHSS